MREVAGGGLCGRRTVGLTAAAAGRPAAVHLHAGRHRVRPVHHHAKVDCFYCACRPSETGLYIGFTNILGERYKVFWKKSSTKIISPKNHWEKGNYDSSSGDHLRNSKTSRSCVLELDLFLSIIQILQLCPFTGGFFKVLWVAAIHVSWNRLLVDLAPSRPEYCQPAEFSFS